MGDNGRRRNEGLLLWLRGAAIAAATYGGLIGMRFSPQWGAVLLASLAGVAALGSTELGVVVAIVSLALPITAANPVFGIVFVVLGLVGVRYLGADGGRAFLIVAASVAGAFFGPVWAAVAVAGYLMSAGSAAMAAAVACLVVEITGVALGSAVRLSAATIGSGARPILDFSKAPESLFSVEWIAKSFGAIDAKMVDGVIASVTGIRYPLAFVSQPAIWAGGAAVTAMLVREARRRKSRPLLYSAVAVGTLATAVGVAVLASVVGLKLDWGAISVATASSLVLALGFTLTFELVFPIIPPAPKEVRAHPSSMAAEDADVDELLRLVATCEEKLATDHTTEKVVMITDMKSFSKMTEEDGSIVTAKAIQQHRDLLLPLIESHGGHGKSTGGDGLVAAFEQPAEALAAAVEMQRALHHHNESHPGGREMSVRIGVAQGEVVLDKGGRPFIGAALNTAARVMNLADGGQAFTTEDVARRAGKGFVVHSHGTFQLKNIATPVEVIEVLWHDEQDAQEPQRPNTE